MSLIEDVNIALRSGDYARAAGLASHGLSAGLRDPTLYNVAAFHHSEAGRFEEALALLREGLSRAPGDHHLLYSTGFCLFRLGQDREAMEAFEAALAVRPTAPAPLQHMGMIFERMGEEDQAERCYRQAMALDPRYEDPHAGLASIAATRGDFAVARDHAARALAIAPMHPTAHLAVAKSDFDDGRFDAVRERLELVLARADILASDRPAFLALLGDALNALDQPDAAFAAWAEAKRRSRDLYANTAIAATATINLERIATLRAFVEGLPPMTPSPPPAPSAHAPREHVFLMGFPRSGTTLLEQVLAAHDDVVTLEEKPLMAEAELEFLVSPDAFRGLLDPSEGRLAPFRELYWRRVEERGLAVAGKVFVDKFPLSSLLTPLIARLFPTARILFAERDPRDVVFSCFRRPFRMNPAMYQFVTPEGAARFYDQVMGLALAYRRRAPLAFHTVRYEALVAEFETECRAICAFVGLEWSADMMGFAERARRRAIHTPSAPQVRKGLYADGAGQWRRYRDQLAPILPVLTPWVAQFGYEPDGGAA